MWGDVALFGIAAVLGVGFFSVGIFGLAAYTTRRENRRLDDLAHRLAGYPAAGLMNLSPADIMEARERWPAHAAYASILARIEGEVRTRAAVRAADAAFEAEYAHAPRYPVLLYPLLPDEGSGP